MPLGVANKCLCFDSSFSQTPRCKLSNTVSAAGNPGVLLGWTGDRDVQSIQRACQPLCARCILQLSPGLHLLLCIVQTSWRATAARTGPAGQLWWRIWERGRGMSSAAGFALGFPVTACCAHTPCTYRGTVPLAYAMQHRPCHPPTGLSSNQHLKNPVPFLGPGDSQGPRLAGSSSLCQPRDIHTAGPYNVSTC